VSVLGRRHMVRGLQWRRWGWGGGGLRGRHAPGWVEITTASFPRAGVAAAASCGL